MNKDAEDTAKIILAEIARAKGWTQIANPNDLFLSSETIISALAYLVGPLMTAEQEYRKKTRAYMEAGKSAAAAEVLAKSEDEYIYWKKLSYAYDLGNEQIRLLKRFRDSLEDEYKRS